ncbi:MAG: PAS domain S-box protein [Bacillota bacterium]|nr:PAS domain S-box protein [Bacillota bacterium]
MEDINTQSWLTWFNSSPDALMIIDRDQRVIVWNKVMETLTGIPSEQVLGRKDYLHALLIYGEPGPWLVNLVIDPSLEKDYHGNLTREGEVYHSRGHLTMNGKEFYFWANASPIRDEQGEIIGATETIRDMTTIEGLRHESQAANEQLEAAFEELMAIEEELRQQYEDLQYTERIMRESERRVRNLLESVHMVAVILDMNKKVTFINHYALQLTGWTEVEVIGQSYMKIFFGQRHWEAVDEWVNRGLYGEETVQYGSVPSQLRNGEIRYIDWNSTVLFDSEGNREGVAILGNDVTERVVAAAELRKQLNYTNTLIDNMNELFYTYNNDMHMTFINKKSNEVLGYSPEELIGTSPSDHMFPKKEWEWIGPKVMQRLQEGVPENYVIPVRHRDGRQKYLKINSTPIIEEGQITGAMVLADDITEETKVANALRSSEQNLRRITDNMMDLISEIDIYGNLIYASPSHFTVLGYDASAMAKIIFRDFVHPEDLIPAKNELKKVIEKGIVNSAHLRCQHTDGHYVWMETVGSPILQDGRVTGIIMSSRDITDRKRLEQDLRQMSIQDALTQLHNRTYFEEELQRLNDECYNPVGIMVFDLDGLKLVNDTLGHDAGDRLLIKTADILRNSFQVGHLISRVGGDEFAVLLPNTKREKMDQICWNINLTIEAYNHLNPQLPLSLSLGMGLREGSAGSLRDVFKEADDAMYRNKLYNSKSAHSAVVQTLLKALEARDFITEGHGERMQRLVVLLGTELGMNETELTTLRLFAHFHDIGKVGVPDRILFKEAALTREEYEEMKRHCEIGKRIALASPELTSIADLILMHHEWWNGNGYPLHLSGERIPMECRILALTDAYDAMTSDRPYRAAMSSEAAKDEIRRCAGTQFDPYLSGIFLDLLE